MPNRAAGVRAAPYRAFDLVLLFLASGRMDRRWRLTGGGGGKMEQRDVRGQRLVALCLLGFLLFNYPLLAVFNVQATLFGIPVLYVYFFVAWGTLIALMMLVIERRS
jgi:hypothetical protein